MLLEVSWVFLLVAFIIAALILKYYPHPETESDEHKLGFLEGRRRKLIVAMCVCMFFSALLLFLHVLVPADSAKLAAANKNATVS